MREISRQTAADYLRDRRAAVAGEPVEVRELSGGVSNAVYLIGLPQRGERFVLKQARGQLRVQHDWRCPVERIWREIDVLQVCGELLSAAGPSGAAGLRAAFRPGVPQLLWDDRENYAYAMTAAPADHRTWKELLLAGELPLSLGVAEAAADLLAALHTGSWGRADLARSLADQTFFDQLRIDPYYRQIARVHADLAGPIERLIASLAAHPRCLVHGDYSPKNLLVWPGHVLLIDFEVGHYGDPAFDLGFFLTHLVLKAIWSEEQRERYLRLPGQFWSVYARRLGAAVGTEELALLERRLLPNLAGCLLARIDGKSPVDYLTGSHQEQVRRQARRWLAAPPSTLAAALAEVARSAAP